MDRNRPQKEEDGLEVTYRIPVERFQYADELHEENRALKNMFLMGILCKFYLNMEFESDSIRLMKDGEQVGTQNIDFYPTTKAYDELASSAIINQLERLKKTEKEYSNNIFDLMYDFKVLENMINGEIKDYVAQKNDVVARAVNLIGMITSESNLESISKSLNDIQNQLSEKKEGGE